MPHLAIAVAARKFHEAFSTFEADNVMAQVFEGLEIASWAATEVQNSIRGLTIYVFEQRIAILAYVMIFRAVPKTVRVCVVMTQGDSGSLREFFGAEPWSMGCSHAMDKDTGRSAGCDLEYAKPLGRIQYKVLPRLRPKQKEPEREEKNLPHRAQRTQKFRGGFQTRPILCPSRPAGTTFNHLINGVND